MQSKYMILLSCSGWGFVASFLDELLCIKACITAYLVSGKSPESSDADSYLASERPYYRVEVFIDRMVLYLVRFFAPM